MISNPYSREKPTMADQRLGRLAMLSQVGDQNDLADARDQAGDMEALKSLYGIASESATQPYKIGQLQSETAKNTAGVGAENARTTYETAMANAVPDKAEAALERNVAGEARGLQTMYPGGIPHGFARGLFPSSSAIPGLIDQQDAADLAKHKSAMLDDATKSGDFGPARASGVFTPEEQATWPVAPTLPDSSPYAVGKRVREIPSHVGAAIGHAADSTAQFLGGLTDTDSTPQPGSGGATTMVPNHPGMPNLGWPFSHVERTAGPTPSPWLPKLATTKPRYNANINPD